MDIEELPSCVKSLSRSSSLRAYGKLYQATPNRDLPTQDFDEHNDRRQRTRCVFASLCCTLAVVVTITMGTVLAVRRRNGHTSPPSNLQSSLSAVAAACNATTYPDLCYQWLSSFPNANDANPLTLVDLGVKVALNHVDEASTMALKLFKTANFTNFTRQAIEDCLELMDMSHDQLNNSMSLLGSITLASFNSSLKQVKRTLSGAMGFKLACSEGLLEVQSNGSTVSVLIQSQDKVGKGITISLDLADKLSIFGNDLTSWNKSLPKTQSRRLLSVSTLQRSDQESSSSEFAVDEDGFPEWLSAEDRRVLQATPSAPTPATQPSSLVPAPQSPPPPIQPSPSVATPSSPSVPTPTGGAYDVSVAQDGSGNYLTINEALAGVPSGRSTRYTIYIKQGVYNEYVSIPSAMNLLTLIGDGIGQTVITGDKSSAQGLTTYSTATVAISAPNFIARKITFRNEAGPEGYQAVAMRVNADQAVFDSCSFEGYQDTLYALANRQFYTACNIYGTIDVIFGNAIAVFQSCNLLGRLPLSTQSNTFTAQGRTVASDPSGYSFQKCTVAAAPDLQSPPYSVQSYYGRPWQAYSRTVFIECSVSQVINPAGWLEWDASDPFTDTVYYGEYQNTGAGADTSNRVAWQGVHPNMSQDEASAFTVESFISGTSWLPNADVAFQASL
ncbi:hypothetical protein KP509_19G056100 [Ceratopteris richardii]|uniref:Pectinesterase inhibitor domain-containing protein n=1 Tax=Ceratopteris richardii TaxID=49495 RepID=A0A8T2SLD3_CERRI|nr:hypothetical protein KP509_19G056100 [Ceratopteris richardii]